MHIRVQKWILKYNTLSLSIYICICTYTQVYTYVHACVTLNCMIVTTRAKIMSEAEKPQFFPAFEAAPDSEHLKPCTLNRSPKLVQTQQDRAQLQPTRRARRHRIGGYRLQASCGAWDMPLCDNETSCALAAVSAVGPSSDKPSIPTP